MLVQIIAVLLWLCNRSLCSQQQSTQVHSRRSSHAVAAIKTLQQWYNENTGLWETTGWWNSANILTALADFTALDSSLNNLTYDVFDNTYNKAQLANIKVTKIMTPHTVHSQTFAKWSAESEHVAGFPGFHNDYYDDEAWWALAWLKIYDLTHVPRYLQTAINIVEDMQGGVNEICGGIWWNKAQNYTGAIENELFLTLAASLANRVDGAQKAYYLDVALKQWQWFEGTGMINSDFNINNGINLETCKNDGGTVWTYNQGVILGGLVELYHATQSTTYLTLAESIALAAIRHLTDEGGILHEPCEPNCGADGPQFKGIFMRNLQRLQGVRPNERFEKFISANAESIWKNARGEGNILGLVWSGPFDKADAGTQSSATEALIADMAVNDGQSAFRETHSSDLATVPETLIEGFRRSFLEELQRLILF